MTMANMSARIFREGVELKRKERYSEAIEKYKECLRIYPENPELHDVFVAMGKVFYLDGRYHGARVSYEVAILTVMERQEQLQLDLIDLFTKRLDDSRRNRLAEFMDYYARHIGHAMRDQYSMNVMGVRGYFNAIAGSGNEGLLRDYEQLCVEGGRSVVEELLVSWMSVLKEKYTGDMLKLRKDSFEWIAKERNKRLQQII